jgi:hypothetical protein
MRTQRWDRTGPNSDSVKLLTPNATVAVPVSPLTPVELEIPLRFVLAVASKRLTVRSESTPFARKEPRGCSQAYGIVSWKKSRSPAIDSPMLRQRAKSSSSSKTRTAPYRSVRPRQSS